jgi:hypothetical protein
METISTEHVDIEINTNAVEPVEYFKILKNKMADVTAKALADQLNTVSAQIIAANRVGQKNFMERLAFVHNVIAKEQILLANGLSKYVYKEDISYFLDNVKPKNSIKIIELERYPRAIPLEVLHKIDHVKSLNIFDDFCVVFTDLTDATYETPSEKEFVKRNRDPIIFGFFKEQTSHLKHDRFYFVVDWEDEYCDLTFTKMLEKMASMDMENVEKEISVDPVYLQELVNNTLASIGKGKPRQLSENESTKETQVVETPKNWFQRIFTKKSINLKKDKK